MKDDFPPLHCGKSLTYDCLAAMGNLVFLLRKNEPKYNWQFIPSIAKKNVHHSQLSILH
jgi:hypothetical protein